MGEPQIFVQCPGCETKVQLRIIAKHLANWPPDDLWECRRFFLGECPLCEGVMLTEQSLVQRPGGDVPEEADWGETGVLYCFSQSGYAYEGSPLLETIVESPLRALWGSGVPEKVRKALEEAEKCLNNGSYGSCAVQCRKAIEAICHEKNCVKGSLQDKLKELCERSVIDSKLLDWAGAIKVLGDRGAHPYRDPVGAEEAKFALEFAVEVARYVFVLNEKYESFKSRGKRQDQEDEDKPDTPESPWVCDPPEEPED